MSNDRNIVRDRTLVLRVLVPGLHTRLNDKISSIQEEDSSHSIPAGRTSGGKSADQLINLDGVTCVPSSSGSTLWHFRCDGASYPARLVNLPCPIEVHKTHDHATYHKSADVGQMLIVYEDEYAMEEAENEKGYKIEGFPSYYHSGLTPPMRKVVRRRFLSRFEERDTKPVPPQKSEVSEVEKEIQDLIAKLSADKGKGKQKKGTPSSSSAKEKIIEEVEEEVVDYEPWMGDGGVFSLEDAKTHPEWWLSKDEIKQLENAKKAEEEKKKREEREAAEAAEAAALAAAAEPPPPSEAPAEEGKKKKKDKKKKKKKKQEEEDLLAEQSSGGKKKGIASLKSREEEQIDEVTQAAMTISQGIDNEELLLGDDMFDFENEDITDLF